MPTGHLSQLVCWQRSINEKDDENSTIGIFEMTSNPNRITNLKSANPADFFIYHT